MKKLLAPLAACAIVLMPSPALAWFGWLDQLTGPGPFIGLLFDTRVVCFGDRVPAILAEEALKREAAEMPPPAAGVKPSVPDGVLASWRAAAKAWAAAVGEPEPVPPATNDPGQNLEFYKKVVTDARNRAAARAAVGVLFSACSRDVVRRSSLDVSVDLWQALHREARFGGGEGVSLTTAKIAYSFSVFKNTNHDILDFAIGGGAYWVASRGFATTDRGVFFEPARFYVHFPSSWRTHTSAGKRWAAIPVFSAAAVVFPNGFGRTAFLSPEQIADGVTHYGHGSEIKPSVAVYLHIYPK